MAEVCTVPVICTVSVLLHIVYYWKHTIQRFNLEDLLNSKNESTCSESWTVRIAIRIRGLNVCRTINNCCVLQCSKEGATLPLKLPLRLMGDLDPRLKHAFLSQPKSTTQSTSRVVRRFCTAHDRVTVYFTLGRPSPLKLPLRMG